MKDAEIEWIVELTGAEGVQRRERIQSLWSGYGELFRVHLAGASAPAVVVKRVTPPSLPRGASSDVAHARKCRSYDVETTWYRTYAARCDDACRVPALIASASARASARANASASATPQWLLVLEDLDAAGFSQRRRSASEVELDACLAWLAAFHARFLGVRPDGLWRVGTYWHLATRAEELAAIDERALRDAAPVLDRKLHGGTYRTLVHGDAKLANFCFAPGGRAVAAVDFQYVGGGCGMQDVAYLLSGHYNDEALERRHLDRYFVRLREALAAGEPSELDVDALEAEWRALYPIACADFYRFLAGWAKDHWRRDRYAQQVTARVLGSLG